VLGQKKIAFYASSILLTFAIVTPLPVFGRRTLNTWIDELFTIPTRWVRQNLFPSYPEFDGFYTDTLNYFILLFFGLLIGTIFSLLILNFQSRYAETISVISKTALINDLAWVFLIYGFSKISGLQFPEIKNLDIQNSPDNQDILFWIWVGGQPILVFVLGILEITIAISLFLQKTTKLGLIAYSIALVIITSLNWYFNVGVLTFSILLLITTIHLLIDNRMDVINSKAQINPYLKSAKLFLSLVIVLLAFFHQNL
jgi:hypothetical protein